MTTSTHPDDAVRSTSRARNNALLAAGLVAGALVPAAVAAALLVSLAVRRPLLAGASRATIPCPRPDSRPRGHSLWL
jgi:hypothetical protein